MQRYAITRRRALPPHANGPLSALEEQVSAWAAAGVEWIQVREKDLPVAQLEALTLRLAHSLDGRGSRLLLNGLPAERALACGAQGVHLPGTPSATAIAEAKRSGLDVSVSCHTPDDVADVVAGGATLIVWAPVFNKVVDGEPVLPGTGLAALQAACRAAGPLPVFALGGITPQTAAACIEAGAAGVAGIRLFAEDSWRSLA